MSANWVTAASQFAGQMNVDVLNAETGGMALEAIGTAFTGKLQRSLIDMSDRMTRRQIRMASRFDANQRIRATQNLISAQRAGLGASGVMGGRTARLLEAQARIVSGRQQMQANLSRIQAETASRVNRIVGRQQSRLPLIKAGQDLLASMVKAGGGVPGG